MYKDLYEVFPEISWVQDKKLREQIVTTFEDALNIGKWKLEDLDTMHFTLKLSNVKGAFVSYRTHIRGVARMCHIVYKEYCELYKDKYCLNYDILIAGALLHDVGKLIEYGKDSQGVLIKSELGKFLRHPLSGAGLAMKHNLPYEIAHILAYHAAEGEGVLKTPEAVVVTNVDMINFDTIKASMGLI